jgi:NADH-quinone oxidoreductase E subunit
MKRSTEEILSKYNGSGRESLIPILQEIQEEQGYISRKTIEDVGEYLDLPASKIYGVATFYNQFRFEPLGKYHIQVCRGTACHVLGSLTVLEELQKILNVNPGQTSRDGLFSLEVVACIGACGLAPLISVNEEFHAKVTPESIRQIIDDYKAQEQNSKVETNEPAGN